jgi:hypothetical protein
MQYTFDLAKLAANVAKHGVWFAAADEFEWATAMVRVDSRKRYGEPRLVALDLIDERVHAMVFGLRDTSVRIISLRRANKREVRIYEDQS